MEIKHIGRVSFSSIREILTYNKNSVRNLIEQNAEGLQKSNDTELIKALAVIDDDGHDDLKQQRKDNPHKPEHADLIELAKSIFV